MQLDELQSSNPTHWTRAVSESPRLRPPEAIGDHGDRSASQVRVSCCWWLHPPLKHPLTLPTAKLKLTAALGCSVPVDWPRP